jgi:hypothetical protein
MDYRERLNELHSEYIALDAGVALQYRDQIKSIQTIYNLLPAEKKRVLTIPSVFRRSYDENFISDYLAFFLDPARNGIGTEPLERFLEASGYDPRGIDFVDVDINREYSFTSGGRIDFLIRIADTHTIGVENKLFSPEGDQQTEGYFTSISEEFPDDELWFIYLTPKGHASSSSEFQSLSYEQVLETFSQIDVRLRDNFRQFFFWQDFLLHLEEYILMKKDEFKLSEKSKLYLAHYDMLRDLENTFEDDLQDYYEYLGAKIVDSLPGRDWHTNFRTSRKWQQVYKGNWLQPQLSIHFEYVFSQPIFSADSFRLMIDVERKKGPRFIEFYKDSLRKPIKEKYKKLGIELLPPSRKVAIALKEYPLDPDVDRIDQQLCAAMEEFSFFVSVIDKKLGSFEN